MRSDSSISVFQMRLLLSTLVICAAFRADMDHLHCSLFPSPLLSSVLLLVLFDHLLFTVTHRRAAGYQHKNTINYYSTGSSFV